MILDPLSIASGGYYACDPGIQPIAIATDGYVRLPVDDGIGGGGSGGAAPGKRSRTPDRRRVDTRTVLREDVATLALLAIMVIDQDD